VPDAIAWPGVACAADDHVGNEMLHRVGFFDPLQPKANGSGRSNAMGPKSRDRAATLVRRPALVHNSGIELTQSVVDPACVAGNELTAMFLRHAAKPSAPIIAAGAVVRHGGKVALVRRNRYGGDISLPKGKLQPGETIEAAAMREVDEEIGQRLEIRGFAGSTRYLAVGIPKVVFYFMMSTDRDDGVPKDSEVAEVIWAIPDEAIRRLGYREDQQLLDQLHRLEVI
jgi:8-oxo-dGTP diphosphatase